MGSPGNAQYELGRAYSLNKKAVTTTAELNTGRDEDMFQIDNPVEVTSTTSNYTVTVPNGVFPGQELFIWLKSTTSATVTVSTTTGDNATLDAAGEFALYKWTDSTNGWKKVAYASGV